MFSRSGLSSSAIGDYSELLALAAFTGTGYEVCYPYGNQPGWDFVVRQKAGRWQTAQVKTVSPIENGENPAVNFTSRGHKKTVMLATDADILVAVHPETGTIWLVPPELFDGKSRVPLPDELIWHGSMNREPINIKRKYTESSQLHDPLKHIKAEIQSRLPADRPDWVLPETWDMIGRWCAGFGYKRIANGYIINAPAVRDRIRRALFRMGLAELPESVRRKDERTKDRKRRKYTRKHPRLLHGGLTTIPQSQLVLF